MVFTPPQATAERREFYQRIDKDSVAPLWEVLGSLVPPRPVTPACRLCGATRSFVPC